MNYQQAHNLAQINGEEVVPTVCGMRGSGGPGGGCGIYALKAVKNTPTTTM